VGVRTLASWLRTMTKETGLGGEYYTNKTGRTTGLGRYTKFELPFLPWLIWHVVVQSIIQMYAKSICNVWAPALTGEEGLVSCYFTRC